MCKRAMYTPNLENSSRHRSVRFLTFLGAFAKLRKATTTFDMSVCPSVRLSVRSSVRMEELGSHWTDFDQT